MDISVLPEAFSNQSQKSPKELTNPLLQKERQKRLALTQQLDESKRQIKRLNQTIEKMSHHQRNTILYFETAIKQLESANQEYKAKLDYYEVNEIKSKKSTFMNQSKLNRSVFNLSMQQSALKINMENKQNMNFLNSQENMKCNSGFCESRQELQEVKNLSASIASTLTSLLHSMRKKQRKECSFEDYDKWAEKLQMERNRRKSDANKTSLQLVKLIHEKLKNIKQCIENDTEKTELISEPLFDCMKMLKVKQKNLMKIPFLQKIDLKQRREDAECFVESAQMMKERIYSMLRQK